VEPVASNNQAEIGLDELLGENVKTVQPQKSLVKYSPHSS
jgi:hypothetical protein